MDDRHFDALTRVLTAGDSRRRVLGWLATLPILGGLLAILSPEETAAKDRRKRRKQRHKKRKKPGKRKGKRGCKPQGKGKVCAGTCGPVKNRQTCGKTVDCGPCDCDPALECCTSDQCANPKPICVGGACTTCSETAPCDNGQICCGGSCLAGVCCEDAECAPSGNDCVNNQCRCGGGSICSGSTPVCWNDACACGDVCGSGCQFTTVQAAINALPDGSTIRLCAGTYSPFTVSKDVTLIGVGDGDDPASNTILDGQDTARVVNINSGVTVTLQDLRVTRGFVTNTDGGGISNGGDLTMTGCTLTDSHAVRPAPGQGFGSAGGLVNGESGTLTMTDCTISNNSGGLQGGGMTLLQGVHTFTNCTFSGNTAGIDGGAVFLNNGGEATFTGCMIGPGNNAPMAAITVWGSSLTLDDTEVFGNDGTTVGGVSNTLGSVTLLNGSTVSDNTPINCAGAITGAGCAP